MGTAANINRNAKALRSIGCRRNAMIDSQIGALLFFPAFIAVVLLAVIAVIIVAFIVQTLYSLVYPWVHGAYEIWLEWCEGRTDD